MIGSLFVVLLASTLTAPGAEPSGSRELFSDLGFERGFALSAASHPAPKEDLGILRMTDDNVLAPPVWRLAQWASRFLLEAGMCKPGTEGAWVAETPGKRVALRRAGNDAASLLLEAKGITEYAGKLRQPGEPWPHLLIEQHFASPIKLNALAQLNFAIEMRIDRCKPDPAAEGKLDKGLHTAQASAYWTVHNITHGNHDYQEMIWFGIPLFDARYDVPPAYYAVDAGKEDASGKFICLLDGKRFWSGRTGDGQWRKLNADLLILMREALATAKTRGYLKTTEFEDLAVTSFNLGWEIEGPYDAALEFRGLSMKAQEKNLP
jgi:hypothetical protein